MDGPANVNIEAKESGKIADRGRLAIQRILRD
jgi:hypothetical protein